ncbi:MAG: thioredoxin domain-containing protein, partial [Planctomycetes bacterium]|nr:thioredoxin domain-containing protein [Planctomycetota bacterium]
RAACFVRDRLWIGGELRRAWRSGHARDRGVLQDYTSMIRGLLDLFETEQQLEWFDLAVALQETLDRDFADPVGGYYLASRREEGLLIRQKPAFDGALPSGNSIAAHNLLRLHHYTLDPAYRDRAEACLRAFADPLAEGVGLPAMACALDAALDHPPEVVIVLPDRESDAHEFLDRVAESFVPDLSLVVAVESDLVDRATRFPWIAGKKTIDGRVTAYVCRDRVCREPTTDPHRFAEQITAVSPYPAESPRSEGGH